MGRRFTFNTLEEELWLVMEAWSALSTSCSGPVHSVRGTCYNTTVRLLTHLSSRDLHPIPWTGVPRGSVSQFTAI